MKHYIFIILLCLLGATSCKKNQLGGTALVKVAVKHHGKPIPFSRVFIKFNAKEFPGEDTLKYDSHILTDDKAQGSFKCYKGDYYLFGYGFDPGVPGRVTGGIAVKVRNKEVVETDVSVTED